MGASVTRALQSALVKLSGAGLVGGTPPVGAQPIIASWITPTMTSDNTGQLFVAVPGGLFPNGIHAVTAITAQGTAAPVVLNGVYAHSLTTLGMVVAAANTASIRLHMQVTGW